MWQVDAKGGNPRQLIAMDHIKNIAWSPNGDYLAIEVDPPGETAHISVIDSGSGEELYRFDGQQPGWGANNQQLIIKGCFSECGLWQTELDGGSKEQITFDSTDSYPAMSPDGQFLTFSSSRDGNWEIYLMPWPDGEPHHLTDRPATDVTSVFGPDGRVYLRTDHYGGWRITVVDQNGAGETTVVEGVGRSDDWGLARPAVK